jgi:hypothetical protein
VYILYCLEMSKNGFFFEEMFNVTSEDAVVATKVDSVKKLTLQEELNALVVMIRKVKGTVTVSYTFQNVYTKLQLLQLIEEAKEFAEDLMGKLVRKDNLSVENAAERIGEKSAAHPVVKTVRPQPSF